MNDYKELPVRFGPGGSLIGVISTPLEGSLAPMACLIPNMGTNHRIGPRRINVKLARQLVARGISAIRFDLAGLGDSGPASGSEHFLTQAVFDLQAAMNLVETVLGIRRFIVLGLCSGATNGLSLAVADSRVIGLLMFDGYAFPGRRSRWERTLQRALAAPLNPAMMGKFTRWLQRKFSAQFGSEPRIFEPNVPEATAALFHRSMSQLAERRVAVFFLYSGTVHVSDRHRDQLGPFAHAPFLQHADYAFIAEIDHNLTSVAAQRIFFTVVCEWALRVVQGTTPIQSQPAASGRAPGTRGGSAASAVAMPIDVVSR